MSESTVTKSLIFKEDLSLATGGTGAVETGVRRTSVGGFVTLTKLDASHIKYRNVSLSIENSATSVYLCLTEADIIAAIATIGSDTGSIKIINSISLTDDLTIPANITLSPEPGAILTVASTKTLTISGNLDAGLYQVFSGAVSFTGTQAVNAAWFGLNDDATTDDYAAILLAYNATPTGGTLEFPWPTAGFALATTWTIAKPINIKFNSDAYYLEIGLTTLCTPTFVWTGGAAPVITISNAAGVWFHGNAAIDCNATATYGLYTDRARYGGWKGKVLIHDPATAGMKLYATGGVANDNTMFMDFENVQIVGPKGLVLDSATPATQNVCHNKFGRLQVNYTGSDAFDLISCDNNAFNEVYLYRNSGTGNGLRFRAYANNNVINHFQGPLGIADAKTCLVDADCRYANFINSYDMLNGQARPNFTATSLSASATYKWTASGSGTGEFYLELAAGGDPGLSPYKPLSIIEDSVYLREGFLGALEASQWGWGDNDTLGYLTIYIRLADDADPDSKAEDFFQAVLCDLAYTDQGQGSSGDYKRKTFLQGDMLIQALNGEAIEFYNYNLGDGMKVLLDPVTRRTEFWGQSGGGGYAKVLTLNRVSLQAHTDFILTTKTPATAGATGTAGTIAWDANFIYICTATNTWKKVAIATW